MAAAEAGDVSAAFTILERGILHAADISGMPARARRLHPTRRAHQPFFDAECQALKRGLRIRARDGASRAALRELERHYHSVVRSKRRAHRVQQLKGLPPTPVGGITTPRNSWSDVGCCTIAV
ncbi:hypothetical protein COCOBI_07-0130 [Coccomyxa sp. Obi]|nr:hypothetical protein COCOBI_07-0090 [Coccomyxa sp. Obi]BDA45226.1 hypothetical protein COCOBI_07-0130 [Coccomyxa sp. Obi]